MDTLGAAIIGCGWVADEYIKGFQRDSRSEVRALFNRTKAKAEACKEKHGLNCPVETDYGDILDRDDVQIVVVATPHDAHTDYVIEAAEAGKHVIIEKPVALTMKDVRRQQQAVHKAGVKTVVSFVLHWNPLLMTIDRLIDESAFGEVFMVEVDYMHRIWCGPKSWMGTRKQGGSAFLAGGCHAVDALRWFARSEVVEVSAYHTTTNNPNEYPGTCTAVMQFENGRVGRATACFDAKMPYVFHIGVYGTEGSVRNDQVYAPKLFPGQNGFMKIPCVLPDNADVAHHPFQGEISHFLDCIADNRRPFPDLDDAAGTMAACLAADLSATEGHPVKTAEIG